MRNSCLVSIIIPVFNVHPFLVEALDSVINQTYKKLEILVIDDGSTDGSGEICDEYARKDERVRVVHQENKGLSAARNTGLNMMRGDVVAFLDSDDKYLADYVITMLSAMKQSNADIVICKKTIHHTTMEMEQSGNERARPSITQGIYSRVNALRALANGSINANVWNKLYKKKLWKEIRFPVGHVYEDIATTYKIFNLCKRVCVIKEVLYLRRIHSGSITSIPSSKSRFDYVLALSCFEKFVEENMLGIFNQAHLKKIRKLKLCQLIYFYVLYYKENNYENDTYCANLRNQITDIVKDVGLEETGFRVKSAYYMIRYCPWILKVAYPMYSQVRRLSRIATKRWMNGVCSDTFSGRFLLP